MFGGIDYEEHPEVSEQTVKIIEESLTKIIGSEVTQDWIDIVQFYTSNKNKSSKEEIENDLKELMGVHSLGRRATNQKTPCMDGSRTPKEIQRTCVTGIRERSQSQKTIQGRRL